MNYTELSIICRLVETIHSIIHIKFYFTVRNNKVNGIKDSIIYYNLGLYSNNGEDEGRICLFNSYAYSAEEIAKFHNWYAPFQVATTQNKVNSYVYYFN